MKYTVKSIYLIVLINAHSQQSILKQSIYTYKLGMVKAQWQDQKK